jgi:acyl carrier protein
MLRSGMMSEATDVNQETVILGSGTPLDSLGFVTFISDLEERVSVQTGQDVFLILTEIHEMNADRACLSAGTLASYIETVTA